MTLLWMPSSLADWYLVSETQYDYLYVDTSTIKIDGQFRTIWGLSELKKLNPETHAQSSRHLKEFNCSKNMERILSITTYSEKNAEGDALGSLSFGNWKKVRANTAAGEVLNFVCNLR
tara:strand:- start:4 stop:357 length:354 start_codon:yes stop_codon:yes gene_type:complete